jgi:hypothetical protein
MITDRKDTDTLPSNLPSGKQETPRNQGREEN